MYVELYNDNGWFAVASTCIYLNAAELLVNTWDTCLLADKDMFGSMVLVALPEGMSMPEGGASGPCLSYSDAEAVQNTLYHEFKVEVRMLCAICTT